jgi:hypothetical protein
LRKLIWFSISLVALGGLMALGRHGPLQQLLAVAPIIGYFRFPCRAIVLFELGIGLMAAIGFTSLCRTSCGAQPIAVPSKSLGFAVLAAVAAACVGPVLWPEHTADLWRVSCGPLGIVIAIALVIRAAKGNRLALRALVVFTAIDLGAYGLSYAVYRDVHSLPDYVANISAPPGKRGQRVAIDVAAPSGQSLRAGNQILLAGFSRIDGYAGLEPARRLNYQQPAVLRVCGVDAVSTSRGWVRLFDALPDTRLVGLYRTTDDVAIDIADVDLTNEVLIETEDRELVTGHLGEPSIKLSIDGIARRSVDRPGKIEVEVSASRPAILVLAESHHRGWTAVANGLQPGHGRELKTLRVNGDFLGCLVPEGRYTVEFRFAPASLRYGRLISVCSLGLLVILIAALRVPRFHDSRGD